MEEMQMIEQICLARSGREADCEDFIFVGDHFLAVLDGVTDKHGLEFDGMRGGRFAALSVLQTLQDLPGELSAQEALRTLSAALKEAIAAHGGENSPPPGVHAAIYSISRREIWSVGSMHVILNGMDYSGKPLIDDVLGQARSAYSEALLADGEGRQKILAEDPGRDLILPVLRLQHHFANNPASIFAYGEINGEEIPADLIHIIPVEKGSEVVLATDGYPEIAPTLHQSEKLLARRLDSDPLMISQPAQTKGMLPGNISFDDRAYLRFLLSQSRS